MLEFLNPLNPEEKHLLLEAPLYVSALIAGADGHINSEEKRRTLELVHTKTFSEKFGVRDIYRELDLHTSEHFDRLVNGLPEETTERQEFLSEKLAGLNTVLGKLNYSFAHRYYKSLREFAFYIATAEGGFWGINSVNNAEGHWVKLPMISEPQHNEEGTGA